ncbi:hypothetical protein DPSP01_014005 [Paraphaeosphaeria sporulosa]
MSLTATTTKRGGGMKMGKAGDDVCEFDCDLTHHVGTAHTNHDISGYILRHDAQDISGMRRSVSPSDQEIGLCRTTDLG